MESLPLVPGLHLSMKDGAPHLLLLEAVSMFRASPIFVSARGTIQPCYRGITRSRLISCPTSQLPSFPGHTPTSPHMFSTHVSMFQDPLTTGPSLILAPQVGGTTKGWKGLIRNHSTQSLGTRWDILDRGRGRGQGLKLGLWQLHDQHLV